MAGRRYMLKVWRAFMVLLHALPARLHSAHQVIQQRLLGV